MSRKHRIETVLQQNFQPQALEVIDESRLHAGHAGARPEGETHFRVKILAAGFAGQSRVAIHRAINTALASEFETGLHALAIEASPPRT